MRSIKFRAWDEDEMVEVTQLNLKTTEHTVFDGIHEYIFNINEKDVMQYIGLEDKNGKEIYEGDIIKGKAIKKEGEFDYFGVVEIVTQSNVHGVLLQEPMYDEDFSGGWRIDQLQAGISLNNITGEIIGNIYENPELLESKS